MNSMSEEEFSGLIHEAFEEKYFDKGNFVASKQAFVDGMMQIQVDSMEAEDALEEWCERINDSELFFIFHFLRRMQAVASLMATAVLDPQCKWP